MTAMTKKRRKTRMKKQKSANTVRAKDFSTTRKESFWLRVISTRIKNATMEDKSKMGILRKIGLSTSDKCALKKMRKRMTRMKMRMRRKQRTKILALNEVS